ncbi:RNA-binding protein [Haladaptatus sp. F3-133]|uniref:RNA-binding protein n=1 Tax=Halorutilus salinus TaxID=2487751 RepID=A0A9Q4C5Y5_9EURY|nr:RNA-binding protein [Halorutilus salinus]
MEFHYVDLRGFCYATEDEERVEAALRHYLPDDYPVEREMTEGHHGDSIAVLSARVDNADDVRYVMNRVLEAGERQRIIEEIEERVDDDCSFHLRLDKQTAYEDVSALGDGLHLRAKVEAYPAKREKAVEAVRRSLEAEG